MPTVEIMPLRAKTPQGIAKVIRREGMGISYQMVNEME